MKQKVVTKAIVKENGKVLLLRRQGGRPSIRGLYELPGGTVHRSDQPKDALEKGMRTHIGVQPETMHLHDVMTFVDPDDRELQYVFLVYEVSLDPRDKVVRLSTEYDKYVWKKLTEIQLNEITESTQQLLGLQQTTFVVGRKTDAVMINDVETTTSVIAYTDGGSRGNPGNSAAGFVLFSTTGHVIETGGAFLGVTTNDKAEFTSVYLALSRALEIGKDEVDIRSDSQQVIEQLASSTPPINPDIERLVEKIRACLGMFHKVTFTHVKREYNTFADGIVNRILDERTKDASDTV